MTAARISAGAAVSAVIVWGFKGVAIGIAGGLDEAHWNLRSSSLD